MMKVILWVVVATALLAGCAPGRSVQRTIKKSPVFERSFTGFVLADAATGKSLCDFNGDHYFTPASNTKLFTLYTCLHLLGDSLPGLRYIRLADSTPYLWPTGDPTFLHPRFEAWQPVYDFLRRDTLTGWTMDYDPAPQRLGKGWAWDDAAFAYSAERSSFPIYGNTRRVYSVTPDSIGIQPAYWAHRFYPVRHATQKHGDQNVLTLQLDNAIYYEPNQLTGSFERFVPVFGAQSYVHALLQDTLQRYFELEEDLPIRSPLVAGIKLIYSTPVDTVYRRMMWQSDNFIAEQLLLLCTEEKFLAADTAGTVNYFDEDRIIQWAKDSLLSGNAPKWVDGSGLSRYNLATPRSLVSVLQKLWREQPRERLFNLFPHNGQPGATLDWFNAPGKPFIFAKTGSMSGVQCMSGYLVAKSGRVLVFSFMNNNFVGPGQPWRAEMQRVLENVYRRF